MLHKYSDNRFENLDDNDNQVGEEYVMGMSYLGMSDVSWVPIVEKYGSGQNVSVIRIF